MASPMTEADITAERTSVEDRLTVMLVLAGLFHLIIILGISFTAPSPDTRGAVPTLEVLLVSEVLPESLQNDEARYLAQRTQQGAGNMDEFSRSQIPTASNAPVDQPGEADGAGTQDAARSLAGGETEAVASTRGSRACTSPPTPRSRCRWRRVHPGSCSPAYRPRCPPARTIRS